MRALTERQARFVEHFALCGNATEAARKAGYSSHTARVIGQENLLKPAVKDALASRQQLFRAELDLTKQDVIKGILVAVQMGREQQNPAVMIQGFVQIAKLLGFFAPEAVRLSMTSDMTSLQHRYAAMSDRELLTIVTGAV